MFSHIMERVFAAEYLTGLSLMFSRSHKCVLTRVFSEMTLSFSLTVTFLRNDLAASTSTNDVMYVDVACFFTFCEPTAY